MKKRAATLLLLLLSLTGEVLFGQEKAGKGALRGSVFVQTAMAEPISSDGAVAMLLTRRDTFYTVVLDGTFLFDSIPLGPARLRLSHVSLEMIPEEGIEIQIKPRTAATVRMTEKSIDIREVTVNGEIPMITLEGDTLKFNAAAVKLLEGDVAMEILSQMPGVEISDAGIKVLGQDVKRTYVNNRMIFGSNTMTALSYIPAGEVVSINTYEEYANKDSLAGRSDDEKVRVLDIRTKNPMITAMTGHALASYGHDLKQGRKRWGAGVTSNFFSEPLLLSANIFANNTGRQSNRMSEIASIYVPPAAYTEQTYADVGIQKLWGDMFQDNVFLVAAYTFDRRDTQSERVEQDFYLPSSDYTRRESADTVSGDNLARSHRARLNFSADKKTLGRVRFNNTFVRTDYSGNSYRGTSNLLDDAKTFGMSRSGMNQDGYDLNSNLLLGTSSRKKISVSVELGYNRNDNDGRGFRIDSLTSTGLRSIVESGPIGVTNKVTADAALSVGKIRFFYGFERNNRYSRRYATDIANPDGPQTDSVNTYDYTQNYSKHTTGVLMNYKLAENTNLYFRPKFETWKQSREERFPHAQDDANAQRALLPYLQFVTRINALGHLSFEYNTFTILPSTEQYRNRLNDSNPYRLIAGNPNLKQSYVHDLKLDYRWISLRNVSVSVSVNGTFTRNAIADKTTFFTRRTELPQWNAVAEAQSTLTEFANLDGSTVTSASIHYACQPRAIKSRLGMTLKFDYKDIPSDIGEALNRNRYYAPMLFLSLNSNFSRMFRLGVSGSGSYIFSENTAGQDNKAVRTNAAVKVDWNLLKRMFISSSYAMTAYNSLDGGFANTSTHMLNAVAGCRFAKGNVEVSLAAYNILDRNNTLSISMVDNYIRNVRRESFGRYFTINIGCRLFKSATGPAQPKGIRLEDGSMRQ